MKADKLTTLQIRPSSTGIIKQVPIENKLHEVLTKPWYKLIFNLQSTILYCTFNFFKSKHYSPALLPVTTGSVTSPMGLGSDSVPVKINLFDTPTYLADSMQFHLEYLLRLADKGVFYVMPTFRGEEADERHLNQFSHIEAEIKGNLEDVLALIDEYISHLLHAIVDLHSAELLENVGTIDHIKQLLQQKAAKRITFSAAVALLGTQNTQYFQFSNNSLIGLTTIGEKKLLALLGDGIWLTHLPKLGVPFYQQDAEDGVHALCADYLAGIGEVIGCGQRHTTLAATKAALTERHIDADNYTWYLEMKESYPLLTSGFGLGLERLLLWLLQHQDIRDIPLISRLKGVHSVP
jgi:asparaginyl-tRNA synthetase